MVEGNWSGLRWHGHIDVEEVRARLDAGADPHLAHRARPLHTAAAYCPPDVVSLLASRVDDVDAESDGRTALWDAVYARRPDNVRALVAAGADPWRPMMSGWSPGRLSLAGPTPLAAPARHPGLTPAETAAAEEGHRLTTAIGDLHSEGDSLACVAGVDAAEAARRLGGTPVEPAEMDTLWEAWSVADWNDIEDEVIRYVGITDVPGGCVVLQQQGYLVDSPGILSRLSAGTVCYGMYANPKSGNQGSITRDGRSVGWDLSPGGLPTAGYPAEEILASYLYANNPVAHCAAHVGIRPTDARPFAGPPDLWLRLPARDYWTWPAE
ncbi:ankyrin repeat domain-containing protein [Longispora sp. NPDC051575]|uniref:ankyrin repeat domain-containing protein n=1 Tax=Longispora sp. NPDC051575 TaxID=3154943 RepID=UPI00342EC5E0